jgi:hypothetical protein
VAIVGTDCLLQLQFVLKWPYCYFHQLRSRLLFGPFTKLAGERVTVTVVQLSEVLERLIENWRVGTNPPSLHLHLIADKVAIVELDCPLQLQFVLSGRIVSISCGPGYCVWSFH